MPKETPREVGPRDNFADLKAHRRTGQRRRSTSKRAAIATVRMAKLIAPSDDLFVVFLSSFYARPYDAEPSLEIALSAAGLNASCNCGECLGCEARAAVRRMQ